MEQKCVPWASARADNTESKYLRIGVSLFEHPKFQSLPPTAQIMYIAMCLDAAGHQEFVFPHARFKNFGLSNSSARSGINALIDAGFIERVYSGRIRREPNVFRFSLAWKNESAKEATNNHAFSATVNTADAKSENRGERSTLGLCSQKEQKSFSQREVEKVKNGAISYGFKTIRQVASLGILPEYRLRLMQKQGLLPGVRAGNRFLVNVGLLIERLDKMSTETISD